MDIAGLSSKSQTTRGAANPGASIPAPKRRWVTRLTVPAVIVVATAALLAYSARDYLLPATSVEVVRAVAVPDRAAASDGEPASGNQASSRVVAQAPGWVEPDPYIIFASALADGIVQRVLVLEGDAVEQGQPLAELVREDAQIALRIAEAELAQAQARYEAAKTDLAQPVALQRAVDVATAQLAEAKAQLIRLDAEVAAEQAKLRELQANYQRVSNLGSDSASRLQIEQADYQMQSQQATVEATRQRRPAMQAHVQRYEAELAAAKRDLELKVQLKRAVDEFAAAVEDRKAKLQNAELRLSRMVVTAPADGVVMNLITGPGDKVMLGGDEMHSAHVVHLYDPKSLQVRVDVPLGDAAKVGVGQSATIIVDVLPDTEFSGTVTRFVHRADISKNTVQVKVEIDDPSPLLKPDMLARVQFRGMAGGDKGNGSSVANADMHGGSMVAITASAIVTGEGERYVWLITPGNQRLKKQPVMVMSDRGDGWVTVHAGLSPGDAVVASPSGDLEEGQRVEPR